MTTRPGKFEGNADQDLAETLHEMIMDGTWEESGDVTTFGLWFAKVDHKGKFYTVTEDSQGFFDYQEYDTETERDCAYDEQAAEYDDFMETQEQEG